MVKQSKVGAALLLALAVTMVPACTHSKQGDDARPAVQRPPATRAKKVAVSPTRATTVELDSGVRVEIPKGAIRGTGTLVVRPLATGKVAPPPEGMVRVAQPVDIHLNGATLTGKAKIVLPVQQAAGPKVVQGILDPATHTWGAELGRYDPKRHLLVTEVSHFSIRDWFRLDLGWVKDFVTKLLLGKFGDQLSDVGPTTCPHQDWPATEGWKVSSTNEPRITWCLDKTGDSRSLRVRDGARYAVMINGPDGLHYTRPVLPITIGSPFLKFEEALNSRFSDKTYTIVRRGEDLTIDLANLEGTTRFRIEPNMTAYLADILEVDIDLVAEILGKVSPRFLPKSLARFKDPHALLDSADAAKCVVGAFTPSDLTLDAQRSSSPVEIAKKLAPCAITALPGVVGFILSGLVSSLRIPGDIIGTLIAGTSAATNPLDYTIAVTAPPRSLSILDRKLPPADCKVRYLTQYSTAEQMGGANDDLGWEVPYDDVPGSGVGRASTTSNVTVLLRDAQGRLQRADLPRLAAYIRDANDVGLFIVCGGGSGGVYWVEQGPPSHLPTNSDRVTLDGVGPIRVGASYNSVELATGHPMQRHYPTLGDDESCVAASFGDENGVTILGGNETIRRVDISEPSQIRTRSGIGIGSTEADVLAAYPGHIETEDHIYVEGGHYLIYHPTDTPNRMILFETDGTKVIEYRVGDNEFTPYEEGCS